MPHSEATAPVGGKNRTVQSVFLGAVCATVIGIYAWSANSGWMELWSLAADKNYYNRQAQGFRSGQLHVRREVPPGLAQLADPYDPAATIDYRVTRYPLEELSYYQGRLYLYFGVTPALALLWPYAVTIGHHLLHKDATVIFFAIGFLAAVGLLWAVWRRYFADVSVSVVSAGTLGLGLASLTLPCLQRSDVYEVAISSGFAWMMVALLLLWKAIQPSSGRIWWQAGASLAYGLALGARPSLLLGAVVLLVPVVRERKKEEGRRKSAEWGLENIEHATVNIQRSRPNAEGKRQSSSFFILPSSFAIWLAALGPVTILGLGLLLHNQLRFDHLLEFGQRYQLNAERQSAIQQFSLGYVWHNIRVGFLEPAQWCSHYPFVRDIVPPPIPKGGAVEQLPFGVLTNIPVVWLALAVPLARRRRLTEEGYGALRSWVVAVVVLLVTTALILLCHNSMTLRYQVEFLSPAVLLAMLGVLCLERAAAGWRAWQLAARWSWGLLLAFSLLFNWFAMVERSAEFHMLYGRLFLRTGQQDQAFVQFQKVLRIQPDNASAHRELGIIQSHKGNVREGIRHLEAAARFRPQDAQTHNDLGMALLNQGRLQEAIGHLEQAVRLRPQDAKGQNDLGVALFRLGRSTEAIGCLAEALRLEPDFTEAHNNLGIVLSRSGRRSEAIPHFETVLRLRPENQQACNELARILATSGDEAVRDGTRAVALAERANELAGGSDAGIMDTLAAAYAEAGRFSDAVQTAQAAMELARGAGRAELAQRIQERLQLYQAGQPYHEQAASPR